MQNGAKKKKMIEVSRPFVTHREPLLGGAWNEQRAAFQEIQIKREEKSDERSSKKCHENIKHPQNAEISVAKHA